MGTQLKSWWGSDYNGHEVAVKIADMIYQFANSNPATVKSIREKAAVIAEKALWKHFIRHYEEAYEVALKKTNN